MRKEKETKKTERFDLLVRNVFVLVDVRKEKETEEMGKDFKNVFVLVDVRKEKRKTEEMGRDLTF